MIKILASLYILLRKTSFIRSFRQPLKYWLIGVSGLFSYHSLAFIALRSVRNVSAAEPPPDNYLRPLTMFIGSTFFLPLEKLHWCQIVGAVCGFVGIILAATECSEMEVNVNYNFGNFIVFSAVTIWAMCFVISRYFQNASRAAIVVLYFIASSLPVTYHFIFIAAMIRTQSLSKWTATILLGLSRLGLVFNSWVIGVQHGIIQLLGKTPHLAAFFSVLRLLIFAFLQFIWQLISSCISLSSGAIIASKNLLFEISTSKIRVRNIA
ncbi:DMT family transporter [uncultured Bartonella sp.]|uniref:DMT family transporter n=1 Tax=uncultured Bartonella sp. TaxID=104108 RepID=UPI0025F438AD|nr:DMT family transporter [uncultured Bartonella sp.]